ncbi:MULTISPECIES: spore germination protein [unclassified Bacillus (in: firmicutes)]|uniref:spore germination protein n=1 Tax=unclassified Bacillus (in: firmicutes) TaxID=185979 RepID=UPI0008ED10CA|nr:MULTISPECIES: spore germination protein [unclassified Bacillus (in: firmicutes)]SFA85961.1 GerA spore germination protein [Bacillus sp. UNCCL13]SFQ83553.1 GerA spore germination protein [Bacillus sp. cl95]
MRANSTPENHWLKELLKSNDFVDDPTSLEKNEPFWISYYRTLINVETLHRDLLPYLHNEFTLIQLRSEIPIQGIVLTKDPKEIHEKILKGHVAVRRQELDVECLLVDIANNQFRTVGLPTMESTALGPQVGFIEELDMNVNLIRKRLPVPELLTKELTVGDLSKTKVAILYMDGIADKEIVNTTIQRIQNIRYDHISDSSYITSMIDDNPNTLFSQSIVTERSDRVVAGLTEGKIVIVVDGSPNVIILPITLIESLNAIEDYSYPWIIGSFYRILRFLSFFIAVLITPLYVAILTYHYELIPRKLLETLVSSTAAVPFPPFFEVLFLELIIELVKEAGTRLPVKVAQTLGIIGGIVIGQAVVEAALTSNVLLILVGLSTLSSFATPIYKVGNTLRFIKFPMIVLAQFMGLLGISIGCIFAATHMLRISSFGTPFIGLYPLRKTAFQDLWIRLPFSKQTDNPINLRPERKKKSTSIPKHPKRKTDFSE